MDKLCTNTVVKIRKIWLLSIFSIYVISLNWKQYIIFYGKIGKRGNFIFIILWIFSLQKYLIITILIIW